MEWTHEQYRLAKRDLRRKFGVVGWILLVYYGILNVSVLVSSLVELVAALFRAIGTRDLGAIAGVASHVTESAWGYFLGAAVGLVILLVWKKPRYWKEEIWKRGKPMRLGSFLGILSLFLSGQLVYQLVMMGAEILCNLFGLSVLRGMEAVAMDNTNFTMFLYGGILAPITEEILFRGLVQRTLEPYGKRVAILCSSLAFGICHGNRVQAPYAFLVGLVLGYVASEYSIAWAMVLHMVNNLVLGDMLPRLTSGMPEMAAALVMWLILLTSAVVSVVVLIVKRRDIRAYRRDNAIPGVYVGCFFSSPGVIALMIVMGISMVASLFLLITPIS